jgi:glycosyltransferase involved in cell wall biosynthesis
MAMKMGAARAATVEGGVDMGIFRPYPTPQRDEARRKFGLAPSHLVCGVVGSLRWTPRQSYCYGLELVEALKRLKRLDVSLLIVGDGSGLERLRALVPDTLRERIVFTGRLPEAEVNAALNAMDVGFITQTLDQLGNFRLTTKLPEYLASGLPIAMSPVPGFYDYVGRAGWPLPAHHPADPVFHQQCAAWLDALTWDEVRARAGLCRPLAEERFDYKVLRPRFQNFIQSLMGR